MCGALEVLDHHDPLGTCLRNWKRQVRLLPVFVVAFYNLRPSETVVSLLFDIAPVIGDILHHAPRTGQCKHTLGH